MVMLGETELRPTRMAWLAGLDGADHGTVIKSGTEVHGVHTEFHGEGRRMALRAGKRRRLGIEADAPRRHSLVGEHVRSMERCVGPALLHAS